ncbi:MAG: antibiotic biosynthesis monooxygenase [Rheinheimera sp.]|nr:antibiotic biosynthesis monooxygenase [Rheinheimera sp.]
MPLLAQTPVPPYYAVIFSSVRTDVDHGYADMAERMVALAAQQAGFLGIESAREALGITVSYWTDLAAIAAWKADVDHLAAQRLGRSQWYSAFKTRIAKVERDYGFATTQD